MLRISKLTDYATVILARSGRAAGPARHGRGSSPAQTHLAAPTSASCSSSCTARAW